MDIKDNLVRLYIKQFIIPKALIFDKPGFVDFKISGKTNVFARQMLVPEDFFVRLEDHLIKKYGDRGRSTLYSIGKKFGYSFSQLGRFENIKDHPGNGVKDWIIIASKFVEGTYASEIRQDSDIKTETVNYVLRNFVICRKLGYDFFLAAGGAAGVIAWLLQNKDIEAYYYDSTAPGEDQTCKVKCAPAGAFDADGVKIFREKNLDNLQQDVQQYNEFNKEVAVKYTKSFRDYLNAGIFSYENGIIKFKATNERFFLMEVSGMYLLELGLKENAFDGEVFDVASAVGEEIFSKMEKNAQSVLELTTALGWGEVMLLPSENGKLKIVINHFPWTGWYKDIDFMIVRGLLSGIFSAVYSRKLALGKPVVDMSNGYLTLLLKET